MKEIDDSHRNDPDSEEPKQSDNDAPESQRWRALVARTIALIHVLISLHAFDPSETPTCTHRIRRRCARFAPVWPDTPTTITKLRDSTTQTWDNRPIRTVRPVMKTNI